MIKMRNSMTGLLILTSLYLLLINGFQIVYSAPGNVNAIDVHRQRIRPISRLIKPSNNQLARIKEPFDTFIVDEDDLFELAKRQTSEDYGHLRFGKRDEFDDYGHMRFGRSGSD